MRGMPGIGRHAGMRQLPRPGRAGGSRGSASVPGLRSGGGPGGTLVGAGGVVTFARLRVTVLKSRGRGIPVGNGSAPRAAARSLAAPAEGAAGCGVQPHGIAGAAERPCRRAAGNGTGAPCRGAVKAAASSRPALTLRRASVVSTASASERVETTPCGAGRRNGNPLHTGGLWKCNVPFAPPWANNARKRRVRNGEASTFSPDPLASGAFLRPTGVAAVTGRRVRAGYPTRAPRGLSWPAPLRGIGMRRVCREPYAP